MAFRCLNLLGLEVKLKELILREVTFYLKEGKVLSVEMLIKILRHWNHHFIAENNPLIME